MRRLAESAITRIGDLVQRGEKLQAHRLLYFQKFCALLDRASTGPRWLQEKRVAESVAEATYYRDGKKYDLNAFCIMPNHVDMFFV